jgi:hypothetical protein
MPCPARAFHGTEGNVREGKPQMWNDLRARRGAGIPPAEATPIRVSAFSQLGFRLASNEIYGFGIPNRLAISS